MNRRSKHTGLALMLSLSACIQRPVATVEPVTSAPVAENVDNGGAAQVDLLVMVDNSNSMAQNQLNILSQLGPLLDRLVSPPCVMRGDSTGRTVACTVAGSVPQYAAVSDLHVALVSSDLGAAILPRAPAVPTCMPERDDGAQGDDGVLNPIARGLSEAGHLPWVRIASGMSAPLWSNPEAGLLSCTMPGADPGAFPPFLSFCSGEPGSSCEGQRDASLFTAQFRCNAALSTGGCALEQPLESVYRALTLRAGPGQPNEGFLRENALLAIVMLTDEEDGSVRDDARDVYNSTSTAWAQTTDLNRRMYLYPSPGSPEDPTWNPDRYVNPRDLSQGLLALKPGHPERIIFAAIAGAPLNIPLRPESTAANERIDWDALLGPPGDNGPDDWYGRRHEQALSMETSQGPVSMRHNDRDVACPGRATGTIPACYREGEPRSCDTYYAAPSRRVLEVARRFDESPLCNGQACRNGVVRSICANDFSSAMDALVRRIATRITRPCLPRRLSYETTAVLDQGTGRPLLDPVSNQPVNAHIVSCLILETRPDGDDSCPREQGRVDPHGDPLDPGSARAPQHEGGRRVCEVLQAPLQGDPALAATAPLAPIAGQAGWFYDTSSDPTNPNCTQRIAYTESATPPPGSTTRLECAQQVNSHHGMTVSAGP